MINLVWSILEMNVKAHLGMGVLNCKGHCLLGFSDHGRAPSFLSQDCEPQLRSAAKF